MISNLAIPHSYHPLSIANYSTNVILILLPLTFVLFSKHCRYFYFVFFWRGAISEKTLRDMERSKDRYHNVQEGHVERLDICTSLELCLTS